MQRSLSVEQASGNVTYRSRVNSSRVACVASVPKAPKRDVRAHQSSVATTAPQTKVEETTAADLSQQYSRAMKDAMGWGDRPYDYDYSRGLYWHEIMPNLWCGSQPRHAMDVEELKRDLGVTHIISLQQDKDMHYWNVNPEEIRQACSQLGIEQIRRPVQDFDPHSLRKVLPSAVAALQNAHSNGGRVYVHCTAGLGRAPGVIIAYLYWFHNMDLHGAYNTLTSIRPCGPKKEAIRGATFDLATCKPMEVFDHLPHDAFVGLSREERHNVMRRVQRN